MELRKPPRKLVEDDAPIKLALKDMVRKMNMIDSLVRMGEEPYEIETTVLIAARDTSVLFFGWLVEHGYEYGAEVLSQMVEYVFENIYLVHTAPRNSIAKASKPRLQEILALVEFAVRQEEWEAHLNPFDSLILFYQFLDEVGYEVDLEKKLKAIRSLKKTMKKGPCAAKQTGFDLVQ